MSWEPYDNVTPPPIIPKQDIQLDYGTNSDWNIDFSDTDWLKGIFNMDNTTPTTVDTSSKQGFCKSMENPVRKALESQGLDSDKWTPYVIAQMAIESNWGKNIPQGSNNFAGIKAARGEASVAAMTKELGTSGYYSTRSQFKKYDTVDEFTQDMVRKLKDKFKAFDGNTSDYVRNIKKHGYFTDSLSKYQSLINGALGVVRKALI